MVVQSISGIRGIYGKDLTLPVIQKYALAFYQFLTKKSKKPRIVIGNDSRVSGEDIKKEFIKVLGTYNVSLIDVGINTTPAIQLGVKDYKAEGGIIITASHNPPEYNGIKFLNGFGSIVEEKDFLEIQSFYTKIDSCTIKPNFKKVTNNTKDLRNRYISFLCTFLGQDMHLINNLKTKIILDPNGGAACVILPELFTKLGLPVIIVNDKLGEFNREIEPHEKSLAYLANNLKKEKADFAVGFDCDADRINIIMSNKQMLSGQYILALCIDEILSQSQYPKKQTVVVNDATSYMVKDIVENHGAHYTEVEVGEINVVHELYRINAIAGGEGSSGGGIFPPSTSRDGILTLLLILKSMARKQKSLGELVKALPVYYTIQEKVSCEPQHQIGMKKKLKDFYISQQYHIQETGDETGGLKVFISENSWIWYRMSKTEPGIFRIMADSKNEQEAKLLLKEGIIIFNKFKVKKEN